MDMSPTSTTPPQTFVRPADLFRSSTSQTIEINDEKSHYVPVDAGGGAIATADEVSRTEEWAELHDILFQSVGLERIQYSLQYVREKIGQSASQSEIIVPQQLQYSGLSASLQDQLIGIYFRYDHVRCPVVDEIEFMAWYNDRDDSPTSPLATLLLSAMIFSAFAHATDEMVKDSQFQSLREGHKALFGAVQSQYHNLKVESEGSLALVQTAILLSYWSPYDSSKEVNSYWIREAFRHATVARLSDPKSNMRKRIVWWCCLMRNRAICLGLRRPENLETHVSGRLPILADFGEEVWKSQFQSRKAKKCMILLFISFCELTETMYAAMKLKTRVSNVSWWQMQTPIASHLIDQVGLLEKELIAWRVAFEELCGKMSPSWLGPGETLQLHILVMMHRTTISALYEQYLTYELSEESNMWMLRTLAMHKVKEASSDVAMLCGSLLKHVQLFELPLTLGAWIILSIAVHLVQVNTQKGFEDEAKLSQLGHLMRILQCLSKRFDGAQFVTRIIDAIINAFRATRVESAEGNSLIPTDSESSLFPSRNNRLQAKEDELLVCVLEIIQSGLASEILYQPRL